MGVQIIMYSIPDVPHTLDEHHKKKKNRNKDLKEEKEVEVFGNTLLCRRGVSVLVGPVLGKVTSTSAIVLLEVDNLADVTIHLIPENEGVDPVKMERRFLERTPQTFFLQDLKPNTSYRVCFSGICPSDAKSRVGRVKTLPEKLEKLRVAVVSCDRPERHLHGEKLMWKELWQRIQNDEIDLMLHVGDQVYAQKESMDASAIYRHADYKDEEDEQIRMKKALRTFETARNRLSDVYRFTWSLPYTAKCLAHVPHLMIWSDNDIFNDFTIAEGISPILVKLGQQCYRLYQRALWDDDITDDHDHSDEYHFHKHGNLGIMMIDMRGNRIDVDGNQFPENPIVSEKQWQEIDGMLADPEITTVMVCSEIPFVSDPPEVIKAGVKKVPFLVDHWGYNGNELTRLLDSLSDWKKAGNGNKDFVLVGGDIHVGHTSVIHDKKNDLYFHQITTPPTTNHVCDFFPKVVNDFNDRYSYVHKVLEHEKNYGYFVADMSTPEKGTLDCSLVGSETTLDST